jgi:hypothetical protein
MQGFCVATDATRNSSLCCARGPGKVCAAGLQRPAYFNNRLYLHYRQTALHWHNMDVATGQVSPAASGDASGAAPLNNEWQGSFLTISANGVANTLVWSRSQNTLSIINAKTGVLLKAITLPGQRVKFTGPTVVNGQAYLGMVNAVLVFRV